MFSMTVNVNADQVLVDELAINARLISGETRTLSANVRLNF